MEIVKSKKTSVIIFIICLLILILGGCAFGQSKMQLLRQVNDNIVTHFPSYTMFFKHKKDTVFVGIMSDSINQRIVSPKLYSFVGLEEIKSPHDFIITFEDGTKEIFPVVYKSTLDKYVEYNFTATAYKNLISKKISFVSLGNLVNFNNKEYSNYFIDFLKML